MEAINIKELNERIKNESSFVDLISMEMNKVIIGQKHLVESLMIGLLSDGHILLEGVPGLAKTLAINTLAKIIDADFARIQFTPDLLPADILGTLIYSQKTEEFQVKKAPSSLISFSPTRLTVPRLRSSPHCLRPCRSAR